MEVSLMALAVGMTVLVFVPMLMIMTMAAAMAAVMVVLSFVIMLAMRMGSAMPVFPVMVVMMIMPVFVVVTVIAVMLVVVFIRHFYIPQSSLWFFLTRVDRYLLQPIASLEFVHVDRARGRWNYTLTFHGHDHAGCAPRISFIFTSPPYPRVFSTAHP